MDKNVGGRMFAPDALRELAPAERAGAEPQAYVKLEGLGKIAYTNLRRPKPLMEVGPNKGDSSPSSATSDQVGSLSFGLSASPSSPAPVTALLEGSRLSACWCGLVARTRSGLGFLIYF